MSKTLNIYKGSEKVGSGASPVHVKLDAGEYQAGTFQATFSDETGNESVKVDVPAFSVAESVIPIAKMTKEDTTAIIHLYVGDKYTLKQTIEPANTTEQVEVVNFGSVITGQENVQALDINGMDVTAKVAIRSNIVAVAPVSIGISKMTATEYQALSAEDKARTVSYIFNIDDVEPETSESSSGSASDSTSVSESTIPAESETATTPAFDPSGDTKPTDANTIDEIKAWLTAHSIDFTGKTLKADLLALVPAE